MCFSRFSRFKSYHFRGWVRIIDSKATQQISHYRVEVITQKGKARAVSKEDGPEVRVTLNHLFPCSTV